MTKPPNLTGLLKDIETHLRFGRSRAFGDSLKELLAPNIVRKLGGQPETDAGKLIFPEVKLTAFHYVSPSLGKWFRCLQPENLANVLELTPLEQYQHEKAYDEVPREINIPIWDKLDRPVLVQFNGAPTPRGYIGVSLDSDQTYGLRNLFNKPDAKDFYEVIDGLRPLKKAAWAKASSKSLAAALEGLRPFVEWKVAKDGKDKEKKDKEKWEEEDTNLLWRAFVFSFFISIHAQGPPEQVLVVPLTELGEKLESELRTGDNRRRLLPLLATFVAVYEKSAKDDQELNDRVEAIRKALRPVAQTLARLELGVLQSDQYGNVVEVENVIRACAMIDKRVQQRVNRYGRYIVKNVLAFQNLNEKNRKTLEESQDVKDVLKVTGANPQVEGLLERLHRAVQGHEKDHKTEMVRQDIRIFLYSEPGCGKETLASLCHLFSPRSLLPIRHAAFDALRRTYEGALKPKAGVSFSDQYHVGGWTDLRRQLKNRVLDSKRFQDWLHKYPTFGCFRLNCAELDRENFDKRLIGSIGSRSGLRLANAFHGTIFLDEINTMVDPRLADRLLRALDRPFSVMVKDDKEEKPPKEEVLRVQVVFGSNMSPEEMIGAGFNSALVFRVAERSFRIPPLRERKEDIAVFTNAHLLKRKDEGLDNETKRLIGKIARISLDGLRLICELKWPDNFRGLRGLLEDILDDRVRRKVEDPEISFDEVIRAVSRREAMGRVAANERRAYEVRVLPASRG